MGASALLRASSVKLCEITASEGKKSFSQGPETWMKHRSTKYREKSVSGG